MPQANPFLDINPNKISLFLSFSLTIASFPSAAPSTTPLSTMNAARTTAELLMLVAKLASLNVIPFYFLFSPLSYTDPYNPPRLENKWLRKGSIEGEDSTQRSEQLGACPSSLPKGSGLR